MQQKQDSGEGDDEFKYEIKQQVCLLDAAILER